MGGWRATLAVALIVMTCFASGSIAAQAQAAIFRATPTSGPPGTVVAVSSITPCVLPAGVTGTPFAEVTLARANTVLTRGHFTASPSGAWSGTLTVGDQAALGSDVLHAFCIASPQAEGAFLAYEDVSFTVTADSGLPATGADPWRWGIGGVGLLVAGVGLTLAGARRQSVQAVQ